MLCIPVSEITQNIVLVELSILYLLLYSFLVIFCAVAVGKAFGVLNDAEKRRRYDMYGSDMEPATSRRQHNGHRHGHYEFEGKSGGIFLVINQTWPGCAGSVLIHDDICYDVAC